MNRNPRNAWRWMMVVCSLFSFAALAAEPSKPDSKQAHEWVKKGATLLDVRTVEEFEASHLPQAVNIPVAELSSKLAQLGDKAKPVVVYCQSGRRSAKAAQILKDAGFKSVLDLGGMDNW